MSNEESELKRKKWLKLDGKLKWFNTSVVEKELTDLNCELDQIQYEIQNYEKEIKEVEDKTKNINAQLERFIPLQSSQKIYSDRKSKIIGSDLHLRATHDTTLYNEDIKRLGPIKTHSFRIKNEENYSSLASLTKIRSISVTSRHNKSKATIFSFPNLLMIV